VGTFSDGADIQTRFPSSKLARSCLINNPKPETPRMRPAIKAGLRSFAEAEKAYMRQLLVRGSIRVYCPGVARSEGCPLRSLVGKWTWWEIPEIGADAVQVVDDFSVFDREFADQLLGAVEACIQHVGEAELTLLNS